MSIPSDPLIKGTDYEAVGENLRLLKAVSIGPFAAATTLHKHQSCQWQAEKNTDRADEPLYCELNFIRDEGWVLDLPCGYEWDGSSIQGVVKRDRIAYQGPTTARAFLFHNAIYEGMRRQAVPPAWSHERRSQARKWADKVMVDILRADGCSRKELVDAVYYMARVLGSLPSRPPSDPLVGGVAPNRN